METEIVLTPDFNVETSWDLIKTVTDCNINLEQFFDFVLRFEEHNPGLCESVGMRHFEQFYNELKTEPKRKDSVIYSLNLDWSYENNTIEIPYPNQRKKGPVSKHFVQDPGHINIFNIMHFHGLGHHVCDSGCRKPCGAEGQEQGYAIEFTPINELKHLPIKLNPHIIIDNRRIRQLPEWELPNPVAYIPDEAKITIYPTLWTFIASVFWELTFAGTTPAERNSQLEDIAELKKEALKEFGLIDDDEDENEDENSEE